MRRVRGTRRGAGSVSIHRSGSARRSAGGQSVAEPEPAGPVDGFGPIAGLLQDDGITEVLINGPGSVWVELGGRLCPAAVSLQARDIELLIERLLAPLGLRVDRSSPIVDARLPDGSRVNVVVPPLAVDGPAVSIRRFASGGMPLAAFGPPDMVRMLEDLVASAASTLVVGGTSCGKTTLISSLAERIDGGERLVCIEDTAELRLRGSNIVRLEARPANSEGVGEVTLRRLVLNALRMRPDRIIVGEVRGAEAFDLLLALNSGHRGCLTSCHAADAAGALRRLETLAALAGTNLRSDHLRQLVGDGLDAVIVMNRRGSRRMVESIHTVQRGRPVMRWSSADLVPRLRAC